MRRLLMLGSTVLMMCLFASNAMAQKITVTGTVYDTNGETIIGASVVLVGNPQKGTMTNIDGMFTLADVPSDGILRVSYVGMKAKEVPIKGKTNHVITLAEDAELLDEVVVVGAGTQKKVSVTGAITSVKGSELKVPATNLSSAFAGRIAGVIARQSSGAPGSGAEFYIRGIGTFGGRTTPLILLDDVEISAADLNYVPAENIESFSILKDASATAIYGARGANGVMIVTTKGGDYNQKARVSVNVESSFNFVDRFPKFADGPTFMRMYNEAARARGRAEKYTQEQIERTASGFNELLYPNVDWRKVMFKDLSMRQKANVNVSGGGQKVKYYMSLEVNHDNGILNTQKVHSWNNNISILNYTFQNNITYKLTPTTNIKMNMNAQIRQNKGPNRNVVDFFNTVLNTAPILFPVTFPAQEGVNHLMYGNNYITGNFTYPNPYAMMMSTFAETNQNTLNTVIKIDQDLKFITEGLQFNAWVNFKNWSQSSYGRSINPYFYRIKSGSYDPDDPNTSYELELLNTDGSDYISQTDLSKSSDQTFELQANLNWNRTFGSHRVGAMLLYRQREFRSGILPNRNQGISGRATYEYGERYLAEFNFGYNGTERLSKQDRFNFFPAVSLGWIISNESFFEPLRPVVNHLKLRGSYGLVGSDDLASPGGSYFLYIDKITENKLNYLQWTSGEDMNYTLGGPQISYYAMPKLTWEKVRKLDIGLDIHLLKDWRLTMDYFLDHRYDIFMHREAWPQSLAYHIAKPWSNIGKMKNEGFELSLNYDKRLSTDLSMSLQGTFTYNQNKVLYRDEPNYPTVWKMQIGKPLSPTWGYIAEGLFRSQEEIDNSPTQNLGSIPRVGDIKYRDINGDGKIDSDDEIMISPYNRTPRIQYGFGGTVNYKKFDMGVFFTGSALRTIMINGMDPFQESVGVGPRNVAQYIADNYWSEDNPNWDAQYPRLGLLETDITNNKRASTFWMRDGSFLRLKNAEIGYTISRGRIYVSGANLLTFSKFKLWDPELQGWNSYPMQRTFNVGVQLNF